jgi:hypothetical protein
MDKKQWMRKTSLQKEKVANVFVITWRQTQYNRWEEDFPKGKFTANFCFIIWRWTKSNKWEQIPYSKIGSFMSIYCNVRFPENLDWEGGIFLQKNCQILFDLQYVHKQKTIK